MLIRNVEKTIDVITCYKVNKPIAKYLIQNLLPMFAMKEEDIDGLCYYFIKNENSTRIIENMPLHIRLLGKYELVGREVK